MTFACKPFCKKPVVIQAFQFETNNDGGENMDAVMNWVNAGQQEAIATHNGTNIFIKTLEGVMKANVGDWIIRGVSGEFYPCKPDIFERTYEPVG